MPIQLVKGIKLHDMKDRVRIILSSKNTTELFKRISACFFEKLHSNNMPDMVYGYGWTITYVRHRKTPKMYIDIKKNYDPPIPEDWKRFINNYSCDYRTRGYYFHLGVTSANKPLAVLHLVINSKKDEALTKIETTLSNANNKAIDVKVVYGIDRDITMLVFDLPVRTLELDELYRFNINSFELTVGGPAYRYISDVVEVAKLLKKIYNKDSEISVSIKIKDVDVSKLKDLVKKLMIKDYNMFINFNSLSLGRYDW